MKILSYAKEREHILEEYRDAQFNPESGINAEELENKVRGFFAANPSMPPVTQRAQSFAIILNEAQIGASRHTMFADFINVGINYNAWAGYSFYGKIYRERYQNIFSQRIPEEWAKRKQSAQMGISIPDTDFWHTCPDWGDVMRLGFPGLRQRAADCKEAKKHAGLLTAEMEAFYDAVLICCDAIIQYMRRLYAEAVRVGNMEFAECIQNLTEGPPRTLYEAMETSLFYMTVEEIGRERCRTLGNLDVLYYPFYKADLESGRLNEDEVKELFRFFFNKINAGKRYADQPICIGGLNAEGETAVSEMTDILLDIYGELDISNPKIHVKYNNKFPDATLRKIISLIRDGKSSFVILSDDVVVRAYAKIGIPENIARDYLPLGCYEPGIPGYEDSRICGSWINLAKGVEFAVHGGIDAMTGETFLLKTNPAPAAFEEFYEIYLAHLKSFVDFTMDNILKQVKYAYEVNPHPVYSAALRDCMENGRDIFDNGMNVRNSSIKVFAIGSAVDSLLAVKHYV